MIYYKCDQCQEQLEAPASMSGEALSCPGCGFQMQIPANESIAIPDDEPEEAAPVEPTGFRQVKISANGEVVLNNDNKSLKCPVQQGKRCEYRCAWFGLDTERSLATCQGNIIGQVVNDEYEISGN